MEFIRKIGTIGIRRNIQQHGSLARRRRSFFRLKGAGDGSDELLHVENQLVAKPAWVGSGRPSWLLPAPWSGKSAVERCARRSSAAFLPRSHGATAHAWRRCSSAPRVEPLAMRPLPSVPGGPILAESIGCFFVPREVGGWVLFFPIWEGPCSVVLQEA